MNKIILAAAATALLFGAGACSQEEIVNPSNGDRNVTFTVNLPREMATRAFSNGQTARDLDIAVYDAAGNFVVQPAAARFDEGSLSTTVSLELAKGVAYKIAFFAHDKASGGYTFNAETKTITANYDAMGEKYNTDVFDCFFTIYETEKVSGAFSGNVTLYRPVAQVNWGASDLTSAVVTNAYGADAANLYTKITTTAYGTLDMLTGDVTGNPVDVTLPYLARPAAEETYPVKPETYKYVSMQYLLVPKAGDMVDLTFQTANTASATSAMKTLNVSNVPVQANYQTNIYGKLLTSATDITVEKDPVFGGNINVPADAVDYTDDSALAAGGDVKVAAAVETISIPATMSEALNLYVNEKVNTINLPASNSKPISIIVAKDVDYPEINFVRGAEINGFSLIGDPTSSKLAKGFIFLVNGSSVANCPKSLKNFTLDGVVFDGVGFRPQYSVTTENVLIRNCAFLNCNESAVAVQHMGGGAGQTAKNYTIDNCKVTFAADAPASKNGLYLLDIQGNLTVKNTTVEGATYHGITISGNPYNGNVARASKIEIIGNTIKGAKSADGIKIDGEIEAAITVTGNNVSVTENGIRLKNTLDGNSATVTGNTVDMANTKAFNNGEPWGILIINGTANENAATLIGTAADNIFLNATEHTFSVQNVIQ